MKGRGRLGGKLGDGKDRLRGKKTAGGINGKSARIEKWRQEDDRITGGRTEGKCRKKGRKWIKHAEQVGRRDEGEMKKQEE